jgi:hypothetical protein
MFQRVDGEARVTVDISRVHEIEVVSPTRTES